MYKKIIALLMLVIVTCSACGKNIQKESVENNLDTIIKRDMMIVGLKTDAYPFGYIDAKGHYTGYDAALSRIIAKGILGSEKKVKFIPVTAYDRIMKLYSGEVDMIVATMSITPKRQELIAFSQPYYMAGQTMLVKKGSKIKSLKDMSNKCAIIIFGSTSETSLKTAIPNIKIVGYKTYPEALKALKQGKGDAIIADDTILLGMALKDDSLKLLHKKYSKEPYAVAFRKGEESKDLIKAVNNVIDIESKNGNLKKVKKTFGIK